MSAFTASHRGGSGEPLACVHGSTDTWRSWDLVLPALEHHHDVFAPRLNDAALRDGWSVDAARVECPVRMIWGTDDKLLGWPSAAARYRDDLFPHADRVVMEGVGHCPQIDVPLETSQLILAFTSP